MSSSRRFLLLALLALLAALALAHGPARAGAWTEVAGPGTAYTYHDADFLDENQGCLAAEDEADTRQGEPRLAVDDAGGLFLVWKDNREDVGDIYFARSLDGGYTWTDHARINQDAAGSGQQDAEIVVDGTGTHVYVVWDDDRGGDLDVYFRESQDGGQTWLAEVLVSDGVAGADQSKPAVAVDADGNLVAVWADKRDDPQGVLRAARRPEGMGWSASVQVDADLSGTVQDEAALIADGVGTFHLAFIGVHNGSDKDVQYASSADGLSWTQEVQINEEETSSLQLSPSIAVRDAGEILVVWMDFRPGSPVIYGRYSPDGIDWGSADIRVDDQTASAAHYEPDAAVRGAGDFQVVWREVSGTDPDIHAARSADGTTWSSPDVLVNDDASDTFQTKPVVAIDGIGDVHVAFEDQRNGPAYDIYLATSSDGGQIFGANLRLDSGNRRGLIFCTGDGGVGWSPATLTGGEVPPLWGLVLVSSSIGYAVGEGATLLRSGDGGATWDLLGWPGMTGDEDLRRVFFLDDQHGWAVGSDVCLRTSDGGGSWELVSGLVNGRDVSFATASHGWAVSDLPSPTSVLESEDAGQGWSTASSLSESLYAVEALAEDDVWVAGDAGTLQQYRGGDDTTDWHQAALPAGAASADLRGVAFSAGEAGRGWVVGSDAAIAHTADGGASWVADTVAVPAGTWFEGLSVVDWDTAWAVGNHPAEGGLLCTWACTAAKDCEDDLFCNGTDTCNAGACVADPAGTDPCPGQMCDEENDICVDCLEDGDCDDGAFCTGAETCAGGACQTGADPCPGQVCDEGADACVECLADPDCDDGLFCNGAETCVGNACQPGPDPCPGQGCDEVIDSCVGCMDDADCDDGMFCTGAETCVGGTCQPGADPCDDGVGCTQDTCSEAQESCSHTPDDAVCDDGDPCTGQETCDEVLGCQPGTPVDCNDGIGCTQDSCDPADGICDHLEDDAFCDDGTFCNGQEFCDVQGGGCRPGTPPVCDDGVACTQDSCSPGEDDCVYTPDPARCADGNVCTQDVCDPAAGCENPNLPDGTTCEAPGGCVSTCQGGDCAGCTCVTDADCDDGIPCTQDSCQADYCVNLPDHAACDDADPCNGQEACDPGAGCLPGTPIDCDDGNPCTADACDPADASCDHTPDDELCDDGLWCNGTERCDAVLGCEDGVAPDCADAIACTRDQCDEQQDTCSSTADDALCDDGRFCNGTERCDPAAGCRRGLPPDCDDGIDCTRDGCDDGADACDSLPDDSRCDDGQVCNGAERCDPAAGCLPPASPAEDGVACTGTTACSGACRAGACVVEGFCTVPVAGCEVVPLYAPYAADIPDCRLPEDKIDLRLLVGTPGAGGGGPGGLVPVRVEIRNLDLSASEAFDTDGWSWEESMAGFGLALRLNLDEEGGVLDRPVMGYVEGSAVLQGGTVPIEVRADPDASEVVFVPGDAEHLLPPGSGPGTGRDVYWVLDLLLAVRPGQLREASLELTAWAPCTAGANEIGCHDTWDTDDREGWHRVSVPVERTLAGTSLVAPVGCGCSISDRDGFSFLLLSLFLLMRFSWRRSRNRVFVIPGWFCRGSTRGCDFDRPGSPPARG